MKKHNFMSRKGKNTHIEIATGNGQFNLKKQKRNWKQQLKEVSQELKEQNLLKHYKLKHKALTKIKL